MIQDENFSNDILFVTASLEREACVQKVPDSH